MPGNPQAQQQLAVGRHTCPRRRWVAQLAQRAMAWRPWQGPWPLPGHAGQGARPLGAPVGGAPAARGSASPQPPSKSSARQKAAGTGEGQGCRVRRGGCCCVWWENFRFRATGLGRPMPPCKPTDCIQKRSKGCCLQPLRPQLVSARPTAGGHGQGRTSMSTSLSRAQGGSDRWCLKAMEVPGFSDTMAAMLQAAQGPRRT